MPNPIYGYFKGVKQGEMAGFGSWPGEDDQKGREKSCLIMQFEHLVKVPFDIHSGQASGKRLHGPVRIVKRIDKASPLLYQALCSNEGLSECKFKWYRNDPTGAGGQKHYFSTELEQAVLVEIKQWFPLTADLTRQNYSHFEECAFKYRKITWRWEDGGVTTMDDWQAADE